MGYGLTMCARNGVEVDMLKVVSSLYSDEVCPSMGVIRRRVAEGYGVDISCAAIETCLQNQPWVKLSGVLKNRIAILVGRNATFVDPQDPQDVYPAAMWTEFASVLNVMAAQGIQWKGGRYSCAKKFRSKVPFLQTCSLGHAIHVVQLAIDRKLIGYVAGGSLVPYAMCDMAKKDKLARQRISRVRFRPMKMVGSFTLLRELVREMFEDTPDGFNSSCASIVTCRS